MELSRERWLESRGLLYPLMVIAAIALVVFSLLGIAAITGLTPSALAHSETPLPVQSESTFECAECGVLDSMREFERRDHSGSRPDVFAMNARS